MFHPKFNRFTDQCQTQFHGKWFEAALGTNKKDFFTKRAHLSISIYTTFTFKGKPFENKIFFLLLLLQLFLL